MSEKLVIGKTLMIPCMRKGLCSYDAPVKETILLSQDALERLSKTAHGIPVVIEHTDVNNENVDQVVVGRVADMHYDADTDLWMAHFVLDSQEAVDLLQNGWGVSTAYAIKSVSSGGTLNNVPYDREVTDAEYKHLAIVAKPRYEMARNPIFYNSKNDLRNVADGVTININEPKQSGGRKMISLFKRIFEPIKLNENEDVYVQVDGKEHKLADIMSKMQEMEAEEVKKKEAEAEAEKNKKHVLNEDDVVEYGKEKMTVGELLKRHASMCEKVQAAEPKAEEKKEQSADEPKTEAAPAVEEPAKENSTEAEPKAEQPAVEEPKKEEVTERFNDLDKAASDAQPVVVNEFISMKERMELGQVRYGSKK